jgi:hypothetical protein
MRDADRQGTEPAADTPDLEAEAADPDDPYVKFESRISIGDVADLVFTRATHSTGAQGIAGFLMTLAIMGAVARVHPDLWVPPFIISIAIGTGFLLLPFIWWSYLGAPELMHETVEADRSGMLIHVADRTLRHPWTVYRTAQETKRLFIITSRVVRPLMFTKRELSVEDAAAFRTILTRVDLLRAMDEGPRYRTLLAFVIGGAVAIAVLFVAGAIHL